MIGDRLRKLRKNKGIKQEELANIIGVDKSTISLYEIGKNDPSDKVKIEIAKYFNISLDYLMGVIDEPVHYYRNDLFLKLPNDMSMDERLSLSDYLDFLAFKRNK